MSEALEGNLILIEVWGVVDGDVIDDANDGAGDDVVDDGDDLFAALVLEVRLALTCDVGRLLGADDVPSSDSSVS